MKAVGTPVVCCIPPAGLKEAAWVLLQLSTWTARDQGEPQSLENSSPARSLAPAEAVGKHGDLFFQLKFCNLSYKSCYQATSITESSASQWSRHFARGAWCPNTTAMRQRRVDK